MFGDINLALKTPISNVCRKTINKTQPLLYINLGYEYWVPMSLKKGRPLQIGLLAKVKCTMASSRFHLLPQFLLEEVFYNVNTPQAKDTRFFTLLFIRMFTINFDLFRQQHDLLASQIRSSKTLGMARKYQAHTR